MRVRLVLSVVFILCASFTALAGVISDYQARTESCRMMPLPLEKHPERWDKLSMKFKFRIDSAGQISDIRILSGVPNHWAEETARQALRSLRLPSVPKQVMQAAGMSGYNVAAELVLAKKQPDAIKLVREQEKLKW